MATDYPNDNPHDQLSHARMNGPRLVRDAESVREIGEEMIRIEKGAREGTMTANAARARYGELSVRLIELAASWMKRQTEQSISQ